MPSKLKKAIGAVKDQTSISIAKVASNNTSSSNLEVAVLKATTHDDDPVDTRYVRELLHLVSADKAYAAACARAIGKRIGRTRNWIVTLKSLILVLRIFQDGDPYFPREVLHAMKRGARILNLSSFCDASTSSPWDFTAFVRTFALYLDERLDCFLTGKLQRRFTQSSLGLRGRRPDEPVREMKPAMLLDRIGHWQRLLERAIATRPTGPAKANRLVQIALYAVVEESFNLYRPPSPCQRRIRTPIFCRWTIGTGTAKIEWLKGQPQRPGLRRQIPSRTMHQPGGSSCYSKRRRNRRCRHLGIILKVCFVR
ncbi:unnamed protein product [Cuscuta campestris]|uniref:ENTH domain-containing protein n=1 Tax=Cuscuta campestris TaxID=132261 RepID=A0A484MKT3_9ASTE|nr:unnamed protein product [Cuscuta campestris]